MDPLGSATMTTPKHALKFSTVRKNLLQGANECTHRPQSHHTWLFLQIGVRFVGVLVVRARLFMIYIKALHLWKLPHLGHGKKLLVPTLTPPQQRSVPEPRKYAKSWRKTTRNSPKGHYYTRFWGPGSSQ